MTFAIVAGVLVLGVLGTVLWPLRRGFPRLMLAAIVLLGMAGFALYRVVGDPQALQPPVQVAAPRNLDEAIAQLKQVLQANPEQVEGWLLLGRSLASQQKYPQAREAFAHALKLRPDEPEVLVAVAQTQMQTAADQRLDADSVKLLEHALTLAPDHQRARWLLGVAQRQNNQPAQAAQTWEPLLATVDASTRASLLEQINLARKEAGLAALDPAKAPATDRQGVQVRVSLDPAFAAKAHLPATASVFVIARVPNGPPMPVAVQKHALGELPITLTLGDDDSPMPTQKLSALKQVQVLARVSASGNAIPQPGDSESAPMLVQLPAQQPVELMLGKP